MEPREGRRAGWQKGSDLLETVPVVLIDPIHLPVRRVRGSRGSGFNFVFDRALAEQRDGGAMLPVSHDRRVDELGLDGHPRDVLEVVVLRVELVRRVGLAYEQHVLNTNAKRSIFVVAGL